MAICGMCIQCIFILCFKYVFICCIMFQFIISGILSYVAGHIPHMAIVSGYTHTHTHTHTHSHTQTHTHTHTHAHTIILPQQPTLYLLTSLKVLKRQSPCHFKTLQKDRKLCVCVCICLCVCVCVCVCVGEAV